MLSLIWQHTQWLGLKKNTILTLKKSIGCKEEQINSIHHFSATTNVKIRPTLLLVYVMYLYLCIVACVFLVCVLVMSLSFNLDSSIDILPNSSCYNFLDVRYYAAWQLSAISKSLNLMIIQHAYKKDICLKHSRILVWLKLAGLMRPQDHNSSTSVTH